MSRKMRMSEEVGCVLSPERVAAIKTWRDVIWVPNLPSASKSVCFAASVFCNHLMYTRCTLDGSKSAQLPVLQRAVEAKETSALLLGLLVVAPQAAVAPPLPPAARVAILDAFGEDCLAEMGPLTCDSC